MVLFGTAKRLRSKFARPTGKGQEFAAKKNPLLTFDENRFSYNFVCVDFNIELRGTGVAQVRPKRFCGPTFWRSHVMRATQDLEARSLCQRVGTTFGSMPEPSVDILASTFEWQQR